MARLLKASNQLLYHGTLLSSAKSILQMGSFEPQQNTGGGEIVVEENVENFSQKYNGYTFFTDDYDYAKGYAMTNGNKKDSEPIVVFEMSLPSNLLLPDDIECPTCKNWEESLQQCGQIKVSGAVPINYVNSIIIINSSTHTEIETNVQNFEKDLEDNREKLFI